MNELTDLTKSTEMNNTHAHLTYFISILIIIFIFIWPPLSLAHAHAKLYTNCFFFERNFPSAMPRKPFGFDWWENILREVERKKCEEKKTHVFDDLQISCALEIGMFFFWLSIFLLFSFSSFRRSNKLNMTFMVAQKCGHACIEIGWIAFEI